MSEVYLVVIVYKNGQYVIDRVYGDLQRAEDYCTEFRKEFTQFPDTIIDFVHVTAPYKVC